MQSFRTEIENPIVEKDIIDLANKIELYKHGKVDEEKFRSLRLARGVYGQRQSGVQMIRIKLPYGKISSNQLRRIAEVSDTYSTGRLHITTRQDIQIHYVDLDKTPELWAALEKDDITLREACGNTVRNVTASETAGIDTEEPFDVSPYAEAIYKFFLRNPICQEMGRKFKVSFSASDSDTGLSYMHDLGFIAKIKNGIKGFKVMVGGGLGSQPKHAELLYDFLPSEKIIPLMECILRVFDRHGERKSRTKARLKFLLQNIGLAAFKELIAEEEKAISSQLVPIETTVQEVVAPVFKNTPDVAIEDLAAFELWKATNTFAQKQEGYFAIGIKVLLGDFYTDKARLLSDLVENYAAAELRFSLRQNILIPYVKEASLPFFYQELSKLGFATLGYNKAVDITACPGTDTCNLGIASSTGIATALEKVIREEYPEYISNKDVVIKISGCMNACGQHTIADIGFQGMSIRTKNKLVAPALQVLLGGSNLSNGKGVFADKVIKIPSKRGPESLRIILDDFARNNQGLSFNSYYLKKGKIYFYDLLKDLSDTENLTQEDFIDWGNEEVYKQAIGVGECAGVVIDLVATLMLESDEKIAAAHSDFEKKLYANAIYQGYSAMINAAKAFLVAENITTNTQAGIIEDFDTQFVTSSKISLGTSFSDLVYQIKRNAPTEAFALHYITNAQDFLTSLKKHKGLTTKIKDDQA